MGNPCSAKIAAEMLPILLVESNFLNQCRREIRFFLPGPPTDTGLVLKGPLCLNKDDLT